MQAVKFTSQRTLIALFAASAVGLGIAQAQTAAPAAATPHHHHGVGHPAHHPRHLRPPEAAGYREIREIEWDDGRYEGEQRNAQGERVRIYVSSHSGDGSAPVRASENHVAPEPIVTLSITTPARERFHPLSIGAHWLTALLLVAVHALIELRGIYPKGSAGRELMKTWHDAGLGSVRHRLRAPGAARHLSGTALPARLRQPGGRGRPRPHYGLYAFLVCMPLLGWLVVGARGKASSVRRALWHHCVVRDDTLLYVLPGVSDFPRCRCGPVAAPRLNPHAASPPSCHPRLGDVHETSPPSSAARCWRPPCCPSRQRWRTTVRRRRRAGNRANRCGRWPCKKAGDSPPEDRRQLLRGPAAPTPKVAASRPRSIRKRSRWSEAQTARPQA